MNKQTKKEIGEMVYQFLGAGICFWLLLFSSMGFGTISPYWTSGVLSLGLIVFVMRVEQNA